MIVCNLDGSVEMPQPITVEWLHDIKPDIWLNETRGISHANWSINSIQQRPRNEPLPWNGYNVGPFVWSFAPSHDANMNTVNCGTHYTILVLETRDEVLTLLALLMVK